MTLARRLGGTGTAVILVLAACSPSAAIDQASSTTSSLAGSTSTTVTTVTTSTTAPLSTTTSSAGTSTSLATTTSATTRTTPPGTTNTTDPPPQTTTTIAATTTTIEKTAPVLDHPGPDWVSVVQRAQGQIFHPVHIWRSTLPSSVVERYEWAACPSCGFETLAEYHPGDTYNDGFAEIAHDLEAVSGEYRWRVRAVYADGTEMVSATWRYTVYAFEPITVTGTVTDASTGDPLLNAHLMLVSGPADWRRSTNNAGEFSFDPGPGGPEPPTLIVTKAGYETLTMNLTRGESVTLDLELTASGS